jgi:nitric oxide reductase activation protein
VTTSISTRRNGANLLQSQAQAKNVLLILVGDGLPYEGGYENAYARADTRRAIREAVWPGVGVVGLAIMSSVDPEVHRTSGPTCRSGWFATACRCVWRPWLPSPAR